MFYVDVTSRTFLEQIEGETTISYFPEHLFIFEKTG